MRKIRLLILALFLVGANVSCQSQEAPSEPQASRSFRTPVLTVSPGGGVTASSNMTMFVRTGTSLFRSGGSGQNKNIRLDDPMMEAGKKQVSSKTKSQPTARLARE
jgi:hypothetical protein